MNTTNKVLLAGIITVGGQWAQKKDLSVRIGVGVLFVALGLSALGAWNQGFADDFATLVLVSTVIFNGPALFKAVGLITK